MAFSLHAATVPSYVQMLGSVSALLHKAEAWCAQKGIDTADLLERRMAPDMRPLSHQVKWAARHSIGAIEGVRAGSFIPYALPPIDGFAPLREHIAGAAEALAAIDPAEVDGFLGRDMTLIVGDRRIGFTAEDFLLSFSQPSFYFHCTILYAILRAEGIEIGKRDFLGQQRRKATA